MPTLQKDTFGNDIAQSGLSPVPTIPSTISSTSLNTPQTPVTLPQQPLIDTGVGLNASIPTPQSIISQANAPTAAEAQQSDVMNRLATYVGNEKSLATQQIEQGNAAGLPALSATVRSLSTQLQGYNDQLSKLQLDASAGGTIQNQNQLNAEGRGITVGGNAPLLAGDLRRNQIQQATIASQALTTKAAYYAANNDYLNAKDAADKAAQVAFDASEQQIKYQQALLASIQPQLNKEQAARAALLQSQLADRSQQIGFQREDFKTGQALAIAAMKNYPNDARAQFAGQQALKVDPHGTDYMQKVLALVGSYQQNPLDIQKAVDDHLQAQASIRLANANVAKINAEAQAAQPITVNQSNAPYINAFNNAIAGVGAQTAKQSSTVFTNILNSGDLNAARTYVVRTALSNAPADQQNQAIGRSQALGAMADIQTLLAQAKAKGVSTNLITGTIVDVANKLGTTNNPDLNYISSRILQSLITYRKGMTGVAFGPQEAADYKRIFPDITNIDSLNTAKIQALNDSLSANNRATLGFLIGDQNYDALFPTQNTANLPSNKVQSVPTGQTTVINGHTYKSDGAQWILVQ